MQDLNFDITTREVVLENGDFKLNTNPSTQNGGIIELSKCAYILNPVLGIGIEGVMGSPLSRVAYEMNRWKQQCDSDGAKNATYKISATQVDYADVAIEIDVNYI